MRYAILGPLEVFDEHGNRLDLGTPRQRAVLAILLLHAGRVVSLDRLIDELWGDTPPSAATSTLQAYVSNLRRILEPRRAPRAPATVLVSEPPGYMIRSAADAVDAKRFETLAAEGHAELTNDPEAARAVLADALGLWRGPVLADFAYEEFAAAEIARLNEMRAGAEEDYVDALIACDDAATAAAELERLVAEEPLRERRRAQQMLALYRMGRQAAALRAYDDVRRDLAEGLGIDPSPALQALHRQILDQDPTITTEPVITLDRAPTSAPVEPARAEPGSSFVGRDAELRRLIGLLDLAGHEQCRTAVITGEAGIGKTRLAIGVAKRARELGWSVAWGRCHDDEGAPPLWPWMQCLRALLGGNAVVTPAERDVLAPLLPELGGDATNIETDVETARFRQFETVTQVLVRDADEQPILIVLDDLHWADASSLRLLRLVSRFAKTDRLVILATARSEPGEADSALADAIAEIVRRPSTVRVALEPLTRADVAAFVDATAGVRDEHAVDELYQRSGGNPFFLSELAKLMASESGTPSPEVPTAVSDVVRRRVARLPEDTQALLRAAAVTGRVFDIDTVASVCKVDVDLAFEQLDPALVTGIVTFGSDGLARFAHALLCETIELDLSTVRRSRLHLAIAHAIVERHREELDPYLAVITHHLESAGQLAPVAEVLEFARRAADAAARGLAFDEEVEFRELVCAAYERAPEARERDQLDALIALGLARIHQGDMRGAFDLQPEMIERANRVGDLTVLAETVLAYGAVTGPQVRAFDTASDEVVTALEHVLADLDAGDSELRCRALSSLGTELYNSDARREEGFALTQEASSMAERLGDPVLLSRALHAVVVAGKIPGYLDAQRDASVRLAELDIPAVPDETRFTSRIDRLRLGLRSGEIVDYPGAVAALHADTATRRSPRDDMVLQWADVGAAFFRGDLARAEARGFEAFAFHERTGIWGAAASAALVLQQIRREQGRSAEMLSLLEGDRPELPLLRAVSSADAGDTEGARAIEFEDLDVWPRDFRWLSVAALIARVYVATRDERLRVLYDALTPFRDEVIFLDGTFVCYGAAELHLGLMAEVIEPERAVEHLERAIVIHDRIGAMPFAAEARLALARVVRAGDPERAEGLLDAAATAVAPTDLVRLQGEIDRSRT